MLLEFTSVMESLCWHPELDACRKREFWLGELDVELAGIQIGDDDEVAGFFVNKQVMVL